MEHVRSHVPRRIYFAYADEDTDLAHPRPTCSFQPKLAEMCSLEHAKVTSRPVHEQAEETYSESDIGSQSLFDPVLERALEYYPPTCNEIPTSYVAAFSFRKEHGLDPNDKIDLDLPPLPHLALGSGHAGPSIPPTVQLDALLDKHAWGGDLATTQHFSGSGIRLLIPKLPHHLKHQCSNVRASNMSTSEYFYTHKYLDEIINSSPSKNPFQIVNKIRMRRTKGHRTPKSPKSQHTPESTKAQRKHSRQALRDAKKLGHSLADAMPSEGVVFSRDGNDIRNVLFNQEDAKYAANDDAREALRSMEPTVKATTVIERMHQQDPAMQYVRTPMGDRYLRDRDADAPVHQWGDAEIEEWCSGVLDGTFTEQLVPENSLLVIDNNVDNRISLEHVGGIVQGVDNQHARKEAGRAVLPDCPSYEGYYTFEQPVLENIEKFACPESSVAVESRKIDLMFFGGAISDSHTERPPTIVITENARTCLQSPNPGRAHLTSVGSLRL